MKYDVITIIINILYAGVPQKKKSIPYIIPYTVFPVPYIQNTVHTVHKNSNTVHTVHNKTIPYLLHLEPMKKYF